MAEVAQYLASVQFGDSAKKFGSASVRVSETDAKAYLAAADEAARDATKVGVLLEAFVSVSRSTALNYWKKRSIEANFINDAFDYPSSDAGIYISNKWKVTGKTTNGGIPVIDSFYIPEYLVVGVVMESDGISADLTDEPMANLIVQILDTALSKYGTAFTEIVSIQRNDS